MSSEPIQARKKILIIEDDRFVAEMYSRALLMDNYSVEIAFDGKGGFAKLKTKKFDLVLLDVMLPDILGDEVLRQWRKIRPKTVKTRVIVLTNFQQSEMSRAALESNVDAYLIKADITPRRLREIVAKVLAN